MREDGYVSMWLGVADTFDVLEQYVALKYDDDGDMVPSQFMLDFGLPRWDEACREAEVLDAFATSLPDVLAGFSYDNEVIPQFVLEHGHTLAFRVNAVVLLYNFNHRTPKIRESGDAVRLRFIGVATYTA